MEWNMTHQFNYCLRIVSPHSINIDSGFSFLASPSTIPFTFSSASSIFLIYYSNLLSFSAPSLHSWFSEQLPPPRFSLSVYPPPVSLCQLPTPPSVSFLVYLYLVHDLIRGQILAKENRIWDSALSESLLHGDDSSALYARLHSHR